MGPKMNPCKNKDCEYEKPYKHLMDKLKTSLTQAGTPSSDIAREHLAAYKVIYGKEWGE